MNDTVQDNDNALTEPQAGAIPNHQIVILELIHASNPDFWKGCIY